jgi:hypothetical protein
LKIETAKKVLKKEADFVGWSVPELMIDIKGMEYPLMIYPKRVLVAYEVIWNNRYAYDRYKNA